MLLDTLRKIYKRELNKLKTEIESYKDESNLWRVDKDIINCGGNLCLHMVGNLNAYIGAGLGNTGYVRDRPGEFANKDVPREVLLQMIAETIEIVDETLASLLAADLEKTYPLEVYKEPPTTGYFLVHLVTHLTYHLGQLNYHRRLLDE